MTSLPVRRFAGSRIAAPRLLMMIVALALLALSCLPAAASAQLGKSGSSSSSAATTPTDVYGRSSPRGWATGLIRALGAQDYELASQYFDLSRVHAQRRAALGTEYAKRLEAALNAGGSLMQPVQLSSDSAGRIDDQLPADQERVGSLPGRSGGEEVPLIASSHEEDGGTVWLLSAESLAALPVTDGAHSTSALRNIFPPVFRKMMVGGAPLVDWLILLAAAVILFVIVRLVVALAVRVIDRLQAVRETSFACRLLNAAPTQFSLWVSMLIFLGVTRSMEVAFIARQLVGRLAGAVAFLAFAWFLWRMIDLAADLVAMRMEHSQRFRARSIIIFVRRALKLLLVMFASVQALNILGIDVTTGIAALGLGGLAIALGAQKTVENVVGSVSVVVDEPVRVGDYCKVGDVSGTVEDIGIRSTRIRTSERTRVTIPNSLFSSQQIENFAPRDRYLFAPTLRLAYGLDADGVQSVLEAIRGALGEADYLFPDARANFKGFGESSLDIEIFGWINVTDNTEAINLQEKLLLEIMRRVQGAGAEFAVPARMVRMETVPSSEADPSAATPAQPA
jgi:MscS family membrane protein